MYKYLIKYTFIFFIISIFLLIFTISYNKKYPKKPSILLIAVDLLNFDSINCANREIDDEEDGFSLLCDESIRFTHAYTPSVLSQPALASILTARHPFEIGIWHNGNQFLSSNIETIAEIALKKGYKTSFISGGPPIWSKSNLNQGFELFEDNFSLSFLHFYRPVNESFNLFFKWLKSTPQKKPFLSFIYVPDLQFSKQDEWDNIGFQKYHNNSLKNLSKNLYYLIKKMKKIHIWDSTFFILLGLNGISQNNRIDELKGLNLFSENVQVSLFIKPTRKKRDLGIKWKVDDNVSLIDVGHTLYDIINPNKKSNLTTPPGALPIISLKDTTIIKNSNVIPERNILIESAWSQWHKLSENSRFSLRKKNFLYLYEKKPKVYNTLIDKFEGIALSREDSFVQEFIDNSTDVMQSIGFSPWQKLNQNSIEKYFLASQIWEKKKLSENDFQDLLLLNKKTNNNDKQIISWLAYFALKQQKWSLLEKIALKNKNKIWNFVAKKNLQKNVKQITDKCFQLLDKKHYSFSKRKECNDNLFLKFVDWIKANNKNRTTKQKKLESFLHDYFYAKLDERIASLNYKVGMTWFSPDKRLESPLLVDLALELPRFSSQKKIVKKRLKHVKKSKDFF